jgi:hypothetical protein
MSVDRLINLLVTVTLMEMIGTLIVALWWGRLSSAQQPIRT